MDGRNQAKGDAAAVKYVGTPVPVLTSTTRIGWRQMEVMRKGGGMLDITSIANNQRKMAEKLEDMALNGLPSALVGTDTIYGLRTLPQRNTFSHTFTLATATGAQWLAAFKQAIAAALGDNNFGRITVFVNQGDYTAADTTDYAANALLPQQPCHNQRKSRHYWQQWRLRVLRQQYRGGSCLCQALQQGNRTNRRHRYSGNGYTDPRSGSRSSWIRGADTWLQCLPLCPGPGDCNHWWSRRCRYNGGSSRSGQGEAVTHRIGL